MKYLLLKAITAAIVLVGLYGCSTQQNLDQSFLLSPGMGKQDVLTTMGKPVKNEFDRGIEEWHYCSTGTGADEFIAVYFEQGRVIAMRPYTVTLADAGASGSCEVFVKMGNYSVPDIVGEIRVKYR